MQKASSIIILIFVNSNIFEKVNYFQKIKFSSGPILMVLFFSFSNKVKFRLMEKVFRCEVKVNMLTKEGEWTLDQIPNCQNISSTALFWVQSKFEGFCDLL
jgi:uncharacterized protein (DUF486 family)